MQSVVKQEHKHARNTVSNAVSKEEEIAEMAMSVYETMM